MVSTAITFLTAFAIVVATQIDDITMQSFKDGAVLGVLFAGSRAGIKAVLEAFVASRQ